MRGFACFTLMYLIGCGGSNDQPELGEVEGIVTLDGKPLQDAYVSFSPKEGDGATSTGETDGEGKFKLRYKRDTMGATVGTHVVRVWTVEEDEGDSIDEATGKPIPKPKEIVLSQYNEESILEKEVKEGPQTIDLELKSNG